jgi:1,4-alpha-glucan branching enzyme
MKGEAMKKTEGKKGKRVVFQLEVEPGSEVFVAGTFNEWNPGQYALRDNPNSGVYKTTLALAPGRHEYKFVVNGEWRTDPNCAEYAPNDRGSVNNVILV